MVSDVNTVWVGLTGGIGSGKSQAARELAALGVPIIDADAVAREMTSTAGSNALHEIAAAFGAEILDNSGSLNRAKMRELVFANPQARQQLEHILHPKMMSEIRRRQAAIHSVYGVVELPTLVEHPHFRALVQHILLIRADENVRIQRVCQRSHLNAEQVRAIMRSQADDAQRIALANSIIDNSGTLSDFQAAVRAWHTQFTATCQAA